MEAQLISALQAQGIIVDKRWGLKRLTEECIKAGIEVPAQVAEPAELEIPKVLAEPPTAAPPKADDSVQCISLVDGLHIDKRHLPGTNDDGMSAQFALKERFRLNATLAETLEGRGMLVIVR